MARSASRPGRTLVVFLLVVVAMYAGLAAKGTWSPKLGLDLQGGTRITLQASTATGQQITPDKMNEATSIIDQRVNGSGVSESEVSQQGGRNIVVEIPGPKDQSALVDSVQRTAQLRFRLVAGQAAAQPTPSPSADPSASPSDGASGGPSATPSQKAGEKGGKNGQSASPKGRALSQGLTSLGKTGGGNGGSGNGGGGNGGGNNGNGGTATPVQPSQPASTEVPTDKSSVQELLAWAASPDQKSLKAFQDFQCPAPGEAPEVTDDPSKPLVTCDTDSQAKYLLSPAVIEGTELSDAGFGQPQNGIGWVVTLSFDGGATKTFSDVTRALFQNNGQFAIVLDGAVLSAPGVNSPITDGRAEISGSFTQASSQSLANSLKYGALPLTFTVAEVSEEGPTLAEDQLSAGLWAGGIGLLLVMLYCLVYYRGLGLVVIGSLAVAGAITYAAVLFLSATAGFTLTLPGIAGLIVAVGITADSFIVYFERIRDEMREGRSMRVAVETGWARARATCVAADAVSLLAAVVLYVFAIGVVKGFAFALGISTVIDLIVFFWFTKPLVSWMSRFRFFNSGHKLSGLSPDHIGIERIGSARPAAGGNA